ncbi:MAG: hypothetical protein ABIF19_18075 [Planctomycetota bacterium]
MRSKTWQLWTGSDDCLYCGASLEVYTDAKPGWFCEDDDVRCTECGCPGVMCADGEDAWVSMHDEPGCECEWCKTHPIDGKWADEQARKEGEE